MIESNNQNFVVNKMFVHYNDSGEVYLISNIKESDKNIFEIDLDLIEDFLSGKKNYRNYNIDYFINLNNGVIFDDTEYEKLKFAITLHHIIDKSADADIVIFHDKKNKNWSVSANQRIKHKLTSMPALSFYICKKDDVHYFYKKLLVDSAVLQKETIVLPFTTDLELDLDAISIVTTRRFKSYSICFYE